MSVNFLLSLVVKLSHRIVEWYGFHLSDYVFESRNGSYAFSVWLKAWVVCEDSTISHKIYDVDALKKNEVKIAQIVTTKILFVS